MWSTAPSTPITSRKDNEEPRLKVQSSYEKAIQSADRMREGERHGQVPRHISSNQTSNGPNDCAPVLPQGTGSGGQKYPHIPTVGVSSSSGIQKSMGPEVVSSNHSPSRIHRGFMPNSGPFDATKSTDLPGSRGEPVITTPPHSQTSSTRKTGLGTTDFRPRTQSIEEADKQRENYAPSNSDFFGSVDGTSSKESFCLDLSSLIISHEEEKTIEKNRNRKPSGVSDASTTSVSAILMLPWHLSRAGR